MKFTNKSTKKSESIENSMVFTNSGESSIKAVLNGIYVAVYNRRSIIIIFQALKTFESGIRINGNGFLFSCISRCSSFFVDPCKNIFLFNSPKVLITNTVPFVFAKHSLHKSAILSIYYSSAI